MLIKDIEPIGSFGKSILNKRNIDEIIDQIIEVPLRNACKVFQEKGIETVMSSANKNNVLTPNEKPIEKEIIKGKEFYSDAPTFESAGKGYAWIMLNFDSLSCENKKWLFELEQKKDDNGNPTGEKAIWFMRARTPGFFDYESQGKYIKQKSSENKEEKALSDEFENRHIVLLYNDDYYPKRVVLLRMPINEQTTVEEVDDFFTSFARSFRTQKKEKNKEKVENIRE